jgi:hypothetical protein
VNPDSVPEVLKYPVWDAAIALDTRDQLQLDEQQLTRLRVTTVRRLDLPPQVTRQI